MEAEGLLAGCLADRPTLRAWLDEYEGIAAEYLNSLTEMGIALAPRGSEASRTAAARKRLASRGARFKNAGASISAGFLSSACDVCVGGRGSRTFYHSLRCSRNCWYCFNPNQTGYHGRFGSERDCKADFDAFADSVQKVTNVGLTGGEPLIDPEATISFFAHVHTRCPEAHLRLYTSGDGLDEDLCVRLVEVGLDEIRFSVKIDEGRDSTLRSLEKIDLAVSLVPDVMVEMPVIPGADECMRWLLHELEKRGVRGINLLEFCYPMRRWEEYAARGLAIKNPPFAVFYDYGYAGGLPVAGSELACLELLEWAMDEKLALGVHYCSLDNKNRDQILQMNLRVNPDERLYDLGEDCFYHAAKAFDCDVEVAVCVLHSCGGAYVFEDDGACVVFHSAYADDVIAAGGVVAVSTLVVEGEGQNLHLRELALSLAG